jgi:hypothetical protein
MKWTRGTPERARYVRSIYTDEVPPLTLTFEESD